MNNLETIKKEIFRLFDLSDRLTNFENTYKTNNSNKLKKILIKNNLNYDYYKNKICITINNKNLSYSLNDNKMSLNISNCEYDPFMTRFVSNKQEEIFNLLINDIKLDFKSKGEIFNAFKKYLTKKNIDIKQVYLKKIKQLSSVETRISNNIYKFNNALVDEYIIEVGKTYTENIYIRTGYYKNRTPIEYLKIIKENRKTYQVEYKIKSNKKIINKRINKDKILDFYNIKNKTKFDFRNEYNELKNDMG